MWEILKRRIDKSEFWFCLLGWLSVLLLIILTFTFLFADRPVRGYYLSSLATQAGIGYQVMIDIDWCDDQVAFSTADPDLALSVLKRLQSKEK